MITDDQHREFARTGLVKLSHAVDAAAAAAMVDRIWQHLEQRQDVQRDRPDSWPVGTAHGLRPATAARAFRELGSPDIRAGVDRLLGTGRWASPRRWGRLLVTFPDPSRTEWQLPRDVWHNDFMPVREVPDPRAVQLFVILSDLAPGGGGTLVLTGSHRLIARYLERADVGPHPKRLRAILAADPWLRDLWQPARDESPADRIRRFMIDGSSVDDIALRVVELTGRAGDAYLMHCDTFHCAAPNVADRPRMMATGMLARDR